MAQVELGAFLPTQHPKRRARLRRGFALEPLGDGDEPLDGGGGRHLFGADGASHRQVVDRNARIHGLNVAGVSLLVGAGVVLAASLVALFWPDDDDALVLTRFAADGLVVRW